MWTNEIDNVVIENKNKHSFYEKSLWSHDDKNIIIQFFGAYSWGAIELTSDQYESIDEVSVDTDTYDTQYNTKSRHDINEYERVLFIEKKKFLGVEFCKVKNASDRHFIPNANILEAMSDVSWFEENYGIYKGDDIALYDTLPRNGWVFLGNSYAIIGDITSMGKSNYDYLWISDCDPDAEDQFSQNQLYNLRITFLNNHED